MPNYQFATMTTSKILLFGPQGSGKGTQGEMLADFLHIPLVVTGNIFRKNIGEETELGLKAKEFINKGELVPDQITIAMIADRLMDSDCREGFILDGFPRNIAQADALDSITDISHVLLINISDAEAVKRISGRRACLQCGATYHIKYKPPLKDNICDKCSQEIVQRDDDTEEALKKRLEIYHQESEPILEKYQDKNILHKIKGEQSIEQVWQDVKKVFAK